MPALLPAWRRPTVQCRASSRKPKRKDGSGLDPPASSRRSPADSGAPINKPLDVTPQTKGSRRQQPQSSRYRRKAVSDEELQRQKEQRRRDEEATQRRLQQAAVEGPGPPRQPPVLLIDGYNIINLSPSLKACLGVSDTMEFARAELEKRVQVYARVSGAQCTIVYDASSRFNWRLTLEEQNRREVVDERVDVVFATTMEADSYIINTAQALKKQGCSRVDVVSADRRVLEESSEPADFVIGREDAGRFVQALDEIARGNVESVPIRFRSVEDAGTRYAQYQRVQRAAAAAAREREERTWQLPVVDSPDVALRLAKELGAHASVPASAEPQDQVDELLDPAALSAGLNDLFGPAKSLKQRRRPYQ